MVLPEDFTISPGDTCETLTLITLRKDESILSELISELPAGLIVDVVDYRDNGPRRRAKVLCGSREGWITVATGRNEPLVRKRQRAEVFRLEDVHVGGQFRATCLIPVRAYEAIDSQLVAEFDLGTSVRILEISRTNPRRARAASDKAAGWITLTTSKGQATLGRLQVSPELVADASGTEGASGPSTARSTLELARAGDVAGLRRLLETAMSRVAATSVGLGQPAINCSDLRGRTPLMYAAAFGHEEVVGFLLSNSDLHVNALDDTQKTALHHAAKNSRRSEEGQSSPHAAIVGRLIAAGLMLDARDHNGCTAIMLAAASGGTDVVKVLLDAASNVNAKDFEGNVPLDYARNFGHADIVQLLVAHGAEQQSEDGSEVKQPDVVIEPAQPSRVADAHKRQPRTHHRNSVLWTAGLVGLGGGAAELLAEVIPMEERPPDVSEEDFSRHSAVRKLQAVLEEAVAPRELEAAVEEARGAGVGTAGVGTAGGAAEPLAAEQELLAEAERRVQALRTRARAHDQLLAAVDARVPQGLREAIAAAEDAGVQQTEVERARAVLAEEEPRYAARGLLRQAQDRGDTASLRAALEEARKVKLTPAELGPFEELLLGAESKEQAAAALRKAVESKAVASMRFAIQRAREAGVDDTEIANAEAILKVEEPKHLAREQLAQFRDGPVVDLESLRAAIARAIEVQLEPAEHAAARALLEREEVKLASLQEVAAMLEELKGVELSDIEALREAKERLTVVIQSARSKGATEAELKVAELRRRRLHNAVEDLKGSIRVFCRVRPLSQRERDLGDNQVTRAGDGMTLLMETGNEPTLFAFDAVFMPGTQEEVFEDCRDLVQSALDGYNVTIFAYGQTGAGKTFTMYGTPSNQGTAPRTINEIYRLIQRDADRFNFTVMASMMELYRNELIDLLVAKQSRRSEVHGAGGQANPKLNVHVDKHGSVQIEHLTEEECPTAEALSKLLERGNRQRTVAATAMNSESSRSHLMLSIKIVSVNRETHDQLRGKLLMVDLAGSERLKKSEVTGDMQKEAIEINKSLTALGDVIEALTKGQSHVPYKNHKLTQVMSDALGGTSKTLMFVNCSPASSNADETTMSLKYATRAKNIVNDTKKRLNRSKTSQ